MAITVPKNDYLQISEDAAQITGNVLDNNKGTPPNNPISIVAGSLQYSNDGGVTWNAAPLGQGAYGQFVLQNDGSYKYILNSAAVQHLGAGEDKTEYFRYQVDTGSAGPGAHTWEQVQIEILGQNDKVNITDVSGYGLEGDALVGTPTNGVVDVTSGVATVFNGQLTLGDVDPVTPGVQTDIDTLDTHQFMLVGGSVNVTSSAVDDALLTGVNVSIDPTTGKYQVDGNFDALSQGETATVTFQYYVQETSDAGMVSASDIKTATITVVGSNDAISIKDDSIITYDQLIDGDIYKSILANDGHYVGGVLDKNVDYNDKDRLRITDTARTDLDFINGGGTITVDNTAKTLQYTPGAGAPIAQGHFEFDYYATDGYTDPVGSASVNVNMVTINGDPIDLYRFGDGADNTINGTPNGSNTAEVLSGLGGNDVLAAHDGDDILYGGSGQDELWAGTGDDILVGGTDEDYLVGAGGSDLYVFKKGDGYDTIKDENLPFITDSAGHLTPNPDFMFGFDTTVDTITFDKDSVDTTQVALFRDGDDLVIRYSDNASDVITVKDHFEMHNGVEFIQAWDPTAGGGAGDFEILDQFDIDTLVATIASYDIDGNPLNGVQTATSVHDVYNNTYLMGQINAAFS